jgi:DNA-binding NtrC family response regulator
MNVVSEAPGKRIANSSNGNKSTRLGRIMLVEDDPDLRGLSAEALVHEGYEVDFAENGIRAWKALHLKRYDLLITDNNMPRMTGLQLVGKLRSAGIELPVILASGTAPPEALLKDTTLRFSAVIPKPFTLDQLVQTVKRVLLESACDRDNSATAMVMEETVPG